MNDITRAFFDDYMMPNYAPVDVIPVSGKGSRLYDQAGQEYIDFAGGIAVNALGHAHPDLVNAVIKQSKKLWHVSNLLTNEPALALAQHLTEITFADKVFFSNSGGEANEAALKLARRYSHDRFGDEKDEIIAFNNGFHGRTLFTVAVGGQENYRTGFGPLPGSIKHLPFNDVEVLRAAVSNKTCAIMVEPIQGEGGVVNATTEFIELIRSLCDENNALMIMDEVQTGVGRTGYLYAHEYYGVTPDILTTAKALGGGFPVAATLTTKNISDVFVVGTHGSTYGGNALACAVALTALKTINTPKVLDGVIKRREWITQGLIKIGEKSGCAQIIRGQGLLIGWVLTSEWKGRAREIVNAAQAEGVFVLVAGANVVRLAPSLIIEREDIEEGLTRLDKALMGLPSSHD
ncbi:MAG: aspartate aminotransferase family protein [Acidiferrobacteraceae bacterium]|nr:aspartate aminotransferase family protein [Acidiferrobacteraceae bacterium]|tara:strand:- start:3993 stop:5207 length:1215 start_codon:yes stop_codon:yes gene_type:complete